MLSYLWTFIPCFIPNSFGRKNQLSSSEEISSESPGRRQKAIERLSSQVGRDILQTDQTSPMGANGSLRKAQIFPSFSELDHFFILDGELQMIEDKQQALEGDETQSLVENEANSENEKSPFDPQIKGLIQEINNLQLHYTRWIESFKGYGILQGKILESFEYFSVNKDNILYEVQKLAPEYYKSAELWLKGFDNNYKWADCIAPLIANIAKYRVICNVQEQLTKHEQLSQELKKTYQEVRNEATKGGPSASACMHAIIKVQKIIKQFNDKLTQDQKEALEKGTFKFARFTTKLSSFPLTKIAEISTKTASKVSKYTFNIFRNIWSIWRIQGVYSIQSEWIHRLQPRIVVNIYSNDPDPQTTELVFKKESVSKLYKEAKEFLLLLADYETIEEIQTRCKERALSLEIPETIEDFKQQLKGKDFVCRLVKNYFEVNQEEEILEESQIISLLHKIEKQQNRKSKQKTAQEKLIGEVHEFFFSLVDCEKIEEVRAKFTKIGLAFEVPATIEAFQQQLRNPRFRRHLVRMYYHCTGQKGVILAKNEIFSLLQKREQEKNRQIEQSLPKIIETCQKMTFEEIKTYLAQQHIHFNLINIPNREGLTLPPTNKSEWENCIQNEQFCRALAKQWVDFQETTAQLVLQALRQALLSKHTIESKFLFFRATQYAIGVISALIQWTFCSAPLKLITLSTIVEILVTDISKLGVPGLGVFYIFYPLYPELNFKLESIFMLLAEHLFAVKYKPNEYSLESYKLMIQIRMVEIVLLAHAFQFLLKQIVLWLNIYLIETCLMRLKKKPLVEDSRYIQMSHQYEQYRLNCKERIQHLQKFLFQLRVKDAKLAITPQMMNSSESSTCEDPIEKIVKILESADIDYFPPQVIEFFEDHLGFKLTNGTKDKLQKHLEEFFCASEDEFMGSYRHNRFAYLRA